MERIPVKLYRVPIGHVCNYTHVVARTDLTLFLESSREYYTLAIWSSAKKKTVKSLTRMLFPEKILRELLFVWGQDKCECVDVKNLHGKGSEHDDDPSTSVNDSDGPVPKAVCIQGHYIHDTLVTCQRNGTNTRCRINQILSSWTIRQKNVRNLWRTVFILPQFLD